MTEKDALSRLNEAVSEAGGQSSFARHAGISQSFVSDVLSGKRRPSPRLLRALGLRWKIVPAEGE